MFMLWLRSGWRGTGVERLSGALDAVRKFMGKPWVRWLVLGLFVVQAVTLVFVVNIGTPPDEQNNIDFIQYYAQHSLSPVFDHQAPTYSLGDKTREVDYLYHYGMSLVVRVLPFSSSTDYRIIRLFSVVFAVLSFVVLARVLKRLGTSAAVITVCLLVITNLPMVLLLGSAINNDVMVWLGMGLGLLLILRLSEKAGLLDMVWLLALCCLGGLVKRTLLPFCLLFGIWGLLIGLRHWRVLVAQIRPLKWPLLAVAIVAIVGLGLFTERVGGNLVRYGSVQVSCEQVDGESACYNFWTNVRARSLANLPSEKMLPLPFFVVRWFSDSFFNIVDIQTQYWKHVVRPARLLTPLLAAVLVVGLAYGAFYEKQRFRHDAVSRHRVYVMAVAFTYIFVQLAVNFGTYRHYKVYGIALNGRYIIPSLLPLIGMAGLYWSHLLKHHVRLLTLLAICLVVFTIGGSGLLMMLRNSQLYAG